MVVENIQDLTPTYESMSIYELIPIADSGDSVAQRVCGIRLINSEDAACDCKLGFAYLEKAAEQGDGDALNRLGVAYHRGFPSADIPIDEGRTISYYQRAMNAGNISAYANCALLYLESEDYCDSAKARELFEFAAERGHTGAQKNLGLMYDGINVSEAFIDYEKAKYWYEKAIESGSDGISANNLAVLYVDHLKSQGDPGRIFQLYKHAAEQGIINAQNALGKIYRDNYKDYAHAAYWFAKAANQGHADAANSLSVLWIEEKLGETDYYLTFYYCKVAQKKGVEIAEHNLKVLRNKLRALGGEEFAKEAEQEADKKSAEYQEAYKTKEIPISFYEEKIRDLAEGRTILNPPKVDTAYQNTTITPPQPPAVHCPVCKSTQISAKTKGFGLGKSVAGALIAGPIGALGGFSGSRKNRLVCLNCGHEWSPGSLLAGFTDMINK